MPLQSRSILKSSAIALVVLSLMLTIAWVVRLPALGIFHSSSAKKLIKSPGVLSSGRVSPAEILPDGSGWVLTSAGLELTSNGGTSFSLARSPIPTRNIHDVAISGTQVHIAGVIKNSPVIELSNDSGVTWKVVSLPPGSGNAGTAQFVTRSAIIVGLLVADVTSSNFSSGDWYATSDGGITWTHHRIPASGVVTAVGGELWLSAGPPFTNIYRSTNDGTTWTKVQPPAMANGTALTVAGSLKDGDTVLVSTTQNLSGAPKFGVTIFVSSDHGAIWKVLAHTSFGGQINSGETVTSAIFEDTIWLGSPTDQKVVTISSNGAVATSSTTNQVYPGGAIYSISPSGSSTAWITTKKDQCLSGKTSCTEVGGLIKTVDTGKTWALVNLG